MVQECTLVTANYIAVIRMDTMITALYFCTVLLVGVQQHNHLVIVLLSSTMIIILY